MSAAKTPKTRLCTGSLGLFWPLLDTALRDCPWVSIGHSLWADSFRASPSGAWAGWDAACRAANNAVPGCMPVEHILDDPEGPKVLMAAVCDPVKLAKFSARCATIFSKRPSTLCHGDCRGDNLFCKDGTTNDFAFIGEQLIRSCCLLLPVDVRVCGGRLADASRRDSRPRACAAVVILLPEPRRLRSA